MAHKSKTQQAKAAAKKQNRKDRQEREEAAGIAAAENAADGADASKPAKKESKPAAKQQVAAAAKKNDKPKKQRFQFLRDVQAEMKRVTWPSRQDVVRWSGVVVGALVFFGIYVAVLDNVIITPALVALTGLGA